MYEKQLLSKLIQDEFNKVRMNGDKVILRKVRRKRTIPCVIAGVLTALGIIGSENMSDVISVVCVFGALLLPVFFLTGNEYEITRLAKKYPDKPISEIIKEELV